MFHSENISNNSSSKKNRFPKFQYHYQCDSCSNQSRKALSVEEVLDALRKNGWRSRYGNSLAAATWHCPSCVLQDKHLTADEKLSKLLAGISQEKLDQICQPISD